MTFWSCLAPLRIHLFLRFCIINILLCSKSCLVCPSNGRCVVLNPKTLLLPARCLDPSSALFSFLLSSHLPMFSPHLWMQKCFPTSIFLWDKAVNQQNLSVLVGVGLRAVQQLTFKVNSKMISFIMSISFDKPLVFVKD